MLASDCLGASLGLIFLTWKMGTMTIARFDQICGDIQEVLKTIIDLQRVLTYQLAVTS